MKIQVGFRDGMTGGILTTEHSQSSYGIPVFVPDDYTRDYMFGDCYGPGDLSDCSPFVPREIVDQAVLDFLRGVGYRIEIQISTSARLTAGKGRKMKKKYRVHITCPAKHTTYTDYKTKRSAIKNLLRMTDRATWYATHIEIVMI